MKIISPALVADGTKQIRMGLVLAVALIFLHQDATAAQAPVDLGSASRFAVLAASEITSVPTSAIRGDVGLSPAARSKIGLMPVEVVGTIFAADDGGAVAVMLTGAHGDLTTAYNEAKDRTPVPTGPNLNPGLIPGSGNIGGMNLAPGLYKFTVTALITGSDVTLTGGPDDVWIFQCAQDLQVGSGIKVILAGGARANNIFWQVGTSAVLDTSSVFKGTIMADQSIALHTLATLDGRALARIAAVTLDSNTITVPNTITNTITLLSAAVVTGPYQPVSVHPPATRTITVPMSGSMQFYRIRAGISFRITSITISGGNVVVITFN